MSVKEVNYATEGTRCTRSCLGKFVYFICFVFLPCWTWGEERSDNTMALSPKVVRNAAHVRNEEGMEVQKVWLWKEEQ